MDSGVPSLLQEIQELGQVVTSNPKNNDAESTQKLLSATRKLSIALQKPGILIEDFIYGPMDNVLLKIAIDTGIFKALVESEKPLSLSSLARTTKAEELLLGRVMRGLASFHAVDEIGDNEYGPTKISRAFTTTKGIAGINLFYHLVQPGFLLTPTFLEETQYQNPTDPLNLPFNKYFGAQPFFEYLPQQRNVLEHFNKYMTAQRDGHAEWLDFFPVQESLLGGFDSSIGEGVMIVDIGGGVGQELRALKAKYPQQPGRMILQELPRTIAQVTGLQGVEAMEHDFFTPQPIKSARTYYFRNIFHDWDDNKCREILKQTTAAMKKGYSKLVINDYVIPAQGASFTSTHMDIMVMALAGGRERTEQQWHDLLASAGVKVDKIWTHELESESIIEASLM